MQQFIQHFIQDLRNTSLLEYIAVLTGVISVLFSRKENIWVYPTGLVNTVIYVYLSFKYHLIGEASVNFYYTVLSIWGWILWAKKDKQHHTILHITYSSSKQWMQQLTFCTVLYVGIYLALSFLKNAFYPGVIPWADAFASATAYTGMWLMARKKVESWYWWIATNTASIPLYYVKGLAFTSVYYFILLVLAFAGLAEWRKRGHAQPKNKTLQQQLF